MKKCYTKNTTDNENRIKKIKTRRIKVFWSTSSNEIIMTADSELDEFKELTKPEMIDKAEVLLETVELQSEVIKYLKERIIKLQQ